MSMQGAVDRDAYVASHYDVDGLEEVILRAFETEGVDRSRLDAAELGRIDGFHVMGRAATEALIERVGALPEGTSVIDVGCGIGGTARLLAARCGCRVTGVDLTDAYCRTARSLSARVGLGDLTEFVRASATELPFADETFDFGWTEHVQMNIPDKRRFYGELRRVVRPGGTIAFHDLFTRAGVGPDFPVPWAQEEGMSALAMVDDVRRLLDELGLEVVEWVDVTEATIAWIDGMRARIAASGPPAVGLHVFMGPTAPTKIANMRVAFGEGRMCAIQAVLRRH